jgi:hypothetical protein
VAKQDLIFWWQHVPDGKLRQRVETVIAIMLLSSRWKPVCAWRRPMQLLRKKKRVLSKDAIEARLFADGGVGSNAIDVYAHRLRKRLNEAGADIELHTIRGVGFCAKLKASA